MFSFYLLEETSAEDFHAIFPTAEFDSIEPPLDNDKHRCQIDLLNRLLEYHWWDRKDFYVSGNFTIFYSATQKKASEFRGLDFFVVLDTEKCDRKSWVVWQGGGKYTIASGKYQPIAPNSQGWLWSEELQLYLGMHAEQLRWFSCNQKLILLPEEALQIIKDYVRSLGIDPNQILNQ